MKRIQFLDVSDRQKDTLLVEESWADTKKLFFAVGKGGSTNGLFLNVAQVAKLVSVLQEWLPKGATATALWTEGDVEPPPQRFCGTPEAEAMAEVEAMLRPDDPFGYEMMP